MAYLDRSDMFASAIAQGLAWPALPPIELAVPDEAPASFAQTEWAVIALARSDALSSLREPRRSRLGRLLFGRPRRYALAGERLEALRRLAVEAWRRPAALSLPVLGGFIAAGFTASQLALLLSTTGALSAMAGTNAA